MNMKVMSVYIPVRQYTKKGIVLEYVGQICNKHGRLSRKKNNCRECDKERDKDGK